MKSEASGTRVHSSLTQPAAQLIRTGAAVNPRENLNGP
jgi:hypothetical protein